MTCRRTLLVLAIALVAVTTLRAQTRPRVATTHEASFRRMATSHAVPTYPAASIVRGSQGVAVASVTTTIEGRVEHIDVLQSPDRDIEASVRAALAQWAIPALQPAPDSTQRVLRAKITFYFRIRNAKGVVLAPEQVAGNEDVFAEWNRPASGRVSTPPSTPPRVVVRET